MKYFLVLFLIAVSVYPQTYRKAVLLHYSVGQNVYGPNGSATSVPIESHRYNVDNSLTGADSVWIYEDADYPYPNNSWWNWHSAFDSTASGTIYSRYIDDPTYDIIIIKTCYTMSGLNSWWYQGPQDTTNYPSTFTIYNYQWNVRNVLHKMEANPDKFFVIWNLVPLLDANTTPTYALNDYRFSKWMTDTLATGLDATYGAFPENVYIWDIFTYLDSSYLLPRSYSVSVSDNHLNAAATALLAPLLVEETFDAAIAYESADEDTVPYFHFTDVTGAELSSYHTAYAILTLANTAFHVSSDDSFKVGLQGTWRKDGYQVDAESGDTVYVARVASANYSTALSTIVTAGGFPDTWSVTTKANIVATMPLIRSSNGKPIYDKNGKALWK